MVAEPTLEPIDVEFVSATEVLDLLNEQGITEIPGEGDRVYLELDGEDDIARFHLSCKECSATPHEHAQLINVTTDQLADLVEDVILKLRLHQILVIPVAKWRKVFDAVAFSLADDDDWQEVDAAATVELNTRDPLLCEPGDFQLLKRLIRSLFNDADSPDQGLMIVTTTAQLLMEVVPDGAVRVALGNRVMADEVAEAICP